jgi:zinc finger HIT domain-containing protein 1
VSRGKVTSSVRRILASQKTFANYLADEEAAQLAQGQAMPPPMLKSRRSIDTHYAALPAAKAGNARGKRSSVGSVTIEPVVPILPVSPDDDEPLLQSSIPTASPAEALNELLRAPSLSYAAARAAPSATGVPQRQFCEICGYWGRVKCTRCGARVCGLECSRTHSDTACGKLYA